MKEFVKIVSDVFDDDRLILIDALPANDTITVCWLKLVCLMGRSGDHVNTTLPYGAEELASIIHRPLSTTRAALAALESLGMVEVTTEGVKLCCAGELWV